MQRNGKLAVDWLRLIDFTIFLLPNQTNFCMVSHLKSPFLNILQKCFISKGTKSHYLEKYYENPYLQRKSRLRGRGNRCGKPQESHKSYLQPYLDKKDKAKVSHAKISHIFSHKNASAEPHNYVIPIKSGFFCK